MAHNKFKFGITVELLCQLFCKYCLDSKWHISNSIIHMIKIIFVFYHPDYTQYFHARIVLAREGSTHRRRRVGFFLVLCLVLSCVPLGHVVLFLYDRDAPVFMCFCMLCDCYQIRGKINYCLAQDYFSVRHPSLVTYTC